MNAARPAAGRRGAVLWVAGLALLPQLAFLDTAVSLDGPVFLAVTRRVLEAPGDPFGFHMSWDPTSTWAADFDRNPPLLSYYLAPFAAGLGESEAALRAALLPFPLAAALAFLGIARRSAPRPLAVAALHVATPAFAVLANAFLLDVPVLAWLLLAVYALLRGREPGGARWQLLGGLFAAAAGLTKYVGLAALPLLGAGVWLLYERRRGPALRLLGPPLLLWTLWGLYTAWRYGAPHMLASSDVVFEASSAARLGNHLASVPVYYGVALIFPIALLLRTLRRGAAGAEIAVLGLLLGAAAVTWALPGGEPARRVGLSVPNAVAAALGFAGAFLLLARGLAPRRWRADPVQGFLCLWLAGLLAFSLFANWHVNAADALLAAPPALLLLFRDEALAPSRRALRVWLGACLGVAVAALWVDARQANVYREAARLAVAEIGPRPGARWFVGQWGLQHYLEREGFRPVPPTARGPAELRVGDWVVSARNVSQLEVARNLRRFEIEPVWTWTFEAALPLRTTNGDAGAGFYSHHFGYLPLAFGRAALDTVGLGRVVRLRGGP